MIIKIKFCLILTFLCRVDGRWTLMIGKTVPIEEKLAQMSEIRACMAHCITFLPPFFVYFIDSYRNFLFFSYAVESIHLACNYAYKDAEQDSTLGGN